MKKMSEIDIAKNPKHDEYQKGLFLNVLQIF